LWGFIELPQLEHFERPGSFTFQLALRILLFDADVFFFGTAIISPQISPFFDHGETKILTESNLEAQRIKIKNLGLKRL
jgi:hypothetical protein